MPASVAHNSCRATAGLASSIPASSVGARLRSGRDFRLSYPAKRRPAHHRAKDDEHDVAHRPAERLRARRHPRLEQERVADERQHRREVRQREQAIRARAGARPREPRLDQRAGRRQQEVRQADRHCEQPEDQPRRILESRRLPLDARERSAARRAIRRAAQCGRRSAREAEADARRGPNTRNRREASPGRTRDKWSTPTAAPPNHGRICFAMIGWTRNSRNALTNMVAAYRYIGSRCVPRRGGGGDGTPRILPDENRVRDDFSDGLERRVGLDSFRAEKTESRL